jgi:branched-chain amino acid transport system substrate-binding protein
VHVLEKIGRDLTREKFIAEMDKLTNFDTGVMAGTLTYTPTKHLGATQLYTVGYDDAGKLTVYESWGKKVAF